MCPYLVLLLILDFVHSQLDTMLSDVFARLVTMLPDVPA